MSVVPLGSLGSWLRLVHVGHPSPGTSRALSPAPAGLEAHGALVGARVMNRSLVVVANGGSHPFNA